MVTYDIPIKMVKEKHDLMDLKRRAGTIWLAMALMSINLGVRHASIFSHIHIEINVVANQVTSIVKHI